MTWRIQNLMAEHRSDGAEFVRQKLPSVPLQVQDEIAKLGAGNFLVLELLCRRVQENVHADQVAALMRRLAEAPGPEAHLACIYDDFWSRLEERMGTEELRPVRRVAGLLAAAKAPLNAELLRRALDLDASDLRRALEPLREFLTELDSPEDEPGAEHYRIYHESFAEYLRNRLPRDGVRASEIWADFCLRWADLPAGYARRYVLRFAPAHLRDAPVGGSLRLAAQLAISGGQDPGRDDP